MVVASKASMSLAPSEKPSDISDVKDNRRGSKAKKSIASSKDNEKGEEIAELNHDVKISDSRKSQADTASSKAKISSKKSTTLKTCQDEEYDWDDSLIPECLGDEIFAELDTYVDEEDEGEVEMDENYHSSEDERMRLQAEEDRKKLKGRRPSVADVEGAIPKETLRKLSNKTIRELILHAKKEIERFETENFLYERTIEKLEKPEKIIEELYPGDDEPSGTKTNNDICSSESENEPEDTGEYVSLKPIDEIHVSTDSFFDNMSDNSKAAAISYFQDVGEIAPPNFDVMRFKYGDLVKNAAEDPEYSAEIGVRTRLNTKVFTSRAVLDEKVVASSTSKHIHVTRRLDLNTIFEEIGDENPDYPGFSMSTAKELPIEEKLKFALEEEEDFRHQFYKHETLALREEGGVQVHIDAHKHSIRLLLNLRKDFRAIMKDARHPVTGKLMVEMILRFKRKMRNQISAEETKTRMTIRKIMAIKKRAVHQLKTNKESGNAISQIDFEHLMCENQIFIDEMEEMNLSLKYLKQLSAHFFQILKSDQDSIGRLAQEDTRLTKEIETKRMVMRSFEKTYLKYRNLIIDTNERMDRLKRKLSEYHAPKPLEYIRLKACQYEMEYDVTSLQRKLDEINLSLITARSTFNKYCQMLPHGDQTEFENESWLEEVKREVEEKGLMALLDDDEDEDADDLPAAFKRTEKTKKQQQEQDQQNPKTVRQKAPKQESLHTRKAGRLRTAQTILLAPTKATTSRRKSMKPESYDTDFQYELSAPVIEPSAMF